MFMKADPPFLETERILDDKYPVFGNYLYVIDGRIEQSDVFGTVRDLRMFIIRQGRTADEVRSCDIFGRKRE